MNQKIYKYLGVLLVNMKKIEILDSIDLLTELQKDNLWWRNNKIPEDVDKSFHRSDFYKYIGVLGSRDIQVIIGPRRVGKTILMFQLIKHLIEVHKLDSKRIIYLDLSKPYVAFNIGGITSCLKIFQENILKKDFGDLKKEERVYIFVDEVQKEKEWATILESYRSRYKSVSFIVTGSSGIEINRSASESLVGRANFRYILPLKFRDIVRMTLGYNEEKLKEIKDISQVFQWSVKSKNIKNFYDYIIKELFTSTITPAFEIKVKNILNSYLLKGGYPEFYEEYKYNNWHLMSKRMRDDYFERIISRDVVEAFRLNRPDILRKIYLLVGFDTSNIANFGNYASLIGTRKNTVVDYFGYLSGSFLISSSERYYPKKRPRGEQKKVYVSDVGMRNAVLGITKSDFNTSNAPIGGLVETIVHSHCMRLKYKLHPTGEFSLDYWLAKGIGEIDIILDLNSILIPIEVKYRDKIDFDDLRSLKHFLNEYKQKTCFGMIITKNKFFLKENILAIPAWLFLLIC